MTEKIEGIAQRYPTLSNGLLDKESIEKGKKKTNRLTEEFERNGK